MTDWKDRLFMIVSQVMDVPLEEVDETSSPDTVEDWDSLRHMNLILALEEEFDITFSDEEIPERLRALAEEWDLSAPDPRKPNISALVEYLLMPQLIAAEAGEIPPPQEAK